MEIFQVSAPASLMLCGEHAVVYGKKAIVAAVDYFLHLEVEKLATKIIKIESELGGFTTDLSNFRAPPEFNFLENCFREALPRNGYKINIRSEIPLNKGFGSSAALCVALISALRPEFDSFQIHRSALNVVRKVQKRASGADLAAAIWGGILAYNPNDLRQLEALPIPESEFSVRYAGYKMPTSEVLAKVAAKMQENPEKYQQIYEKMGEVSASAIKFLRTKNFSAFYQQLNKYQQFFYDLDLCDATQHQHLEEVKNYYAKKISGSGLGDCIITFSKQIPSNHEKVNFSSHGLSIRDLTY